jgi:hypothetical protein
MPGESFAWAKVDSGPLAALQVNQAVAGDRLVESCGTEPAPTAPKMLRVRLSSGPCSTIVHRRGWSADRDPWSGYLQH